MTFSARVLLVTSDTETRLAFQRALSGTGLALDVADGAEHAVTLSAGNNYGIVIIAIEPDAGLELVDSLRPRRPDAAFVFASADPNRALGALNRERVDLVAMAPWREAELRSIVRHGLRRHYRTVAAALTVETAADLSHELNETWRLIRTSDNLDLDDRRRRVIERANRLFDAYHRLLEPLDAEPTDVVDVGAPAESEYAEQRVHARVPLAVTAEIADQDGSRSGRTENVSEGGIFVALEQTWPRGAMVTVSFTLPETNESLCLLAEVAWVRPGAPGVGLRFSHLTAQERRIIASFVDHWSAEESARLDALEL